MTKFAQVFIVFASVLLVAGAASAAAGLSQAQCQQLDREYQRLLDKEKNGTLTQADRKRMKQIDDQTNIYCS